MTFSSHHDGSRSGLKAQGCLVLPEVGGGDAVELQIIAFIPFRSEWYHVNHRSLQDVNKLR